MMAGPEVSYVGEKLLDRKEVENIGRNEDFTP
jgi:hypothetical protein